jgi:hypothetical protein
MADRRRVLQLAEAIGASEYTLRLPNTIVSDPRVVALEPELLRFASDDPTDLAGWLTDA